MIENSPATDTLTISIVQSDGQQVLSRLELEYPNLPNEIANYMHLSIVGAISAVTAEWADAKVKNKGQLKAK